MNFVKSIMLSLFSAILFLLAVGLLLAGLMAVDHQLTSRIIHAINQIRMPVGFIVAGLIAFVASLVTYVLAGGRSETASSYTFEGKDGPINVSLRAIEDFIAKHFEEKPVAQSVRARVNTSKDRKRLRVRASVGVWSEQNVKEAGEAVQREITLCLKESLGIDNVEIIPVSVDKIVASKTRKPAMARPPTNSLPSEEPPPSLESKD